MAVSKKIKCGGRCGKEKPIGEFYNTTSPAFPTGKMTICKKCLKNLVDYNDMSTVYSVLQAVDVPFLYDIWDNCVVKGKEKKEDGKTYDVFGNYIRMANSGLNEFKGRSFKDSIYEKTTTNEVSKNILVDSDFNKDALIDKWGIGYDDDELKSFEKKYEFLKDNYPQVTAMHTEALLIYIRYRVKEEFATASGDIAQAEKWGKLADKASERAKINPSQLSKADLTGGLNSFGEVSRAVERAKDIIPILPKFIEKPQDKVDFTLWCYINYIRRMKNLPDADYKDIYNFYEERKQEYKKEDNREFEFEDEV